MIKYRGMTRKKGEKVRLDGTPIEVNWVYGEIWGDFNTIYPYDSEEGYTVYVHTIGEYIGKKDKNGKEIYVGDVLHITRENTRRKYDCIVIVDFWKCGYQLRPITWSGFRTNIPLWTYIEKMGASCEVIGNIYENIKLLKEVE